MQCCVATNSIENGDNLDHILVRTNEHTAGGSNIEPAIIGNFEMATATINTQALVQTGTTGKSSLFARFTAWVHYNRSVKQTVKELSNLTDRELDDLGISRGDITYIAHDSALPK